MQCRWFSGGVVMASLLWAAALGAPEVHAEDYSRSEDAWNGVGYLITTGQEARVNVTLSPTLDLSRLRPSDVLMWLYPQARMPVDDLTQFVREGGRMVLADDVGAGDVMFDALGLTRSAPEDLAKVDGLGPTYAEHYALPMVSPDSEHFLFFNVEQVVANHPALLTGGDPVLPLKQAPGSLIVEVEYGEGAVLAVGDPSLFLNSMLRRFYGNKQLAANIMRYYCAQDPCEVRLVLPETRIEGRYRSGLGRLGALPRVLDEAVLLINGALRSVDTGVGNPPWPLALVLVLLGLAALVVRGLLMGGRAVVEPGTPWPASGISPLRHDGAALAAGHEDADFTEPIHVLMQEVARGGHWARMTALAQGDDSVMDEETQRVHEAVLRIRREAASVQSVEPGPVSADRFMRVLRDVRAVDAYLESRARQAGQIQDTPKRASDEGS